jgi:hypothetical protein
MRKNLRKVNQIWNKKIKNKELSKQNSINTLTENIVRFYLRRGKTLY